MKRSGIYVLVLLLLLAAVAVLCISRLQQEDFSPGEDEVLASPAPSPTPVPGTPTPESTPPVLTPTPTPTPSPTPTPAPTPTPTPTPAPTPAAPTLLDAGTFRADTGTALNLVVDWRATGTGGSATLDVVVKAESYSLFTSALGQSITLNINGTVYTMASPEIAYDGAGQIQTELARQTLTVSRGSAVDISVDWRYGGSYGGVALESLHAAGSANIP